MSITNSEWKWMIQINVTFEDEPVAGPSPLHTPPPPALAVPRGSLVTTTVDELRLCGAIVVGGFGNPLLTGRQTHANITDAVFAAQHTPTNAQDDRHCTPRTLR